AKRYQLFCRQGRSKANPMHTIGICKREAKKIDPSARRRRGPRGPSGVTIKSRQGDKETGRQGEPVSGSPSPCLLVSLSPCLPVLSIRRSARTPPRVL